MHMKKKLKITIYFIFSFLLISPSISDENLNDNEINIYSGMFDFSDDGQRALLFGLQHQNENLIRESVLGEISPVTGFFLTENQAAYLYTGIQAHYKLGDLDFTPSFTPGLYHEGDGKDLGHVIEFKTEVQFSINTSADTKFGFSYNHVSNASLGSKNPGANSYIFNFFKKF
tara:strand:- start:239 stop:754 length:516 start_codon:yes stop_codon:yes gene_type:complete